MPCQPRSEQRPDFLYSSPLALCCGTALSPSRLGCGAARGAPLRVLWLWLCSGCGDIAWPDAELQLGSGRPFSQATGPSAFFSLLLSLFYSAFSPLFPLDSALQLERLVRLPLGKHFVRPSEMLSQVTENPCFGGWPSPARARFLRV